MRWGGSVLGYGNRPCDIFADTASLAEAERYKRGRSSWIRISLSANFADNEWRPAALNWTKLKQRIESRFIPELKGRVEVYTTCYRRAHDDEGELFVTLDGQKIYGAAQYTYWNERAIKCANVQTEAADPKLREQEIEDLLTAEGVIPHRVLTKAAFDSLNQPIEDMLASVHPFIRGLAVLDTRCGRRRLAKIDADNEHPFVRRLLVLRQ